MEKMKSLMEKIYDLVGKDEIIIDNKIINDKSYIKVYITYSTKSSFNFKTNGFFEPNKEDMKKMVLPILFYSFKSADKVIQYLYNDIMDTIN